MTFNYASLRSNTVDPLLARFGKTATLTGETLSGDAWDPTVSETDTEVTVVQTDFTQAERDGTIVQADDIMFLMEASVEPTTADTLTVDGTTYQVVNVMPLRPGSVTMLYRVQARK